MCSAGISATEKNMIKYIDVSPIWVTLAETSKVNLDLIVKYTSSKFNDFGIKIVPIKMYTNLTLL